MSRPPTDAASDEALPVPFDWRVRPEDVPAGGLTIAREASESERAALAAAFDLQTCDAFTLAGRLRNLGSGAYRLSATLRADVVQTCVVSLAPVPSALKEPIEVEFRPDATADAAAGVVDLDAEADIEPVEGGRMDLGRIAVESLSAALDPYPRAAGAAFEWRPDPAAEARANPFAVLRKLKDGD